MLTLDFPGSRKLIDAIDAAVSHDNTRAVTDSLRNSLCNLIRKQEVKLPDCVFETAEGRYTRQHRRTKATAQPLTGADRRHHRCARHRVHPS